MLRHYQRSIICYLPHEPGNLFCFSSASNEIKAYKITPTSPPTIVFAWSVSQNGQGSPWVTTTDGTNNAIVWVVGAQGDQRLHGYDGDTGAVIYAGGGANELMTGTRKWNSGIVARGSIYVANDNKVYAFRVPRGTPTPTPLLQQLHAYCNCYCDSYGNGNPNCHGNCHYSTVHRDCECHGDSETNCHREPRQHRRRRNPNCHRDWESDSQHPDQRPLRDRAATRGRGRLRRQGRRTAANVGSDASQRAVLRRSAETTFMNFAI